ncbi:sensor histidine kinase [Salidesulfovibrio onnuriiensis]|uniref:sensor histidine kinase n=1 Tax=Salidesulfovibrio onnuriiensis TaxID=2583823 RepID=UPI0011CB652B|nr:HAMP domain-containing sensor histidine kinase [Salidesulfovibrio onnuriiensis]
MRINRLYIKFFFSVMIMLVLLTFVVAMTFTVVSRKMKTEHDRPVADVISFIMADDHGRLPPLNDPEVVKVFHKIAIGIQGKIWITDIHGGVRFKSFDGPLPDLEEAGDWDDEGYVPVTLRDGTPGTMSFIFDDFVHKEGERLFFTGLVAVILTIALLSWPIARHITRPLHRLREVMARFAEGDLSARATKICCGKGEISVLADTYNAMADNIEGMIESGRELTANVSHELRSPLARLRVIQQMLSEKLSGTDNERLVKNLDDMEREIEAMDRLIGRILQLSKVSLRPEERYPVNLAQLFASILESYGHLMAAKNIELHVDSQEDYYLEVEEESMAWMLDNIVGNAVKFTPQNGRITFRGIDEPDRCVLEVINSTARPLSDKDLETIFEPFRRGPGETAPGTGLGLALVKRIVEHHGGTVKAQNTPQGFMLRVVLPKV